MSRKGGLVSALLKSLGAAPPEHRPRLGKLANELREDIEIRLTARLTAAAESRPPRGAVDVTLGGRIPAIGHRHPLTILRDRIEAIFSRMGFVIIEGPELEDEYHNFEALNMPREHPARDMQDTLYLAAPVKSAVGSPATLLRTHTSGMQIRYMEKHQPPVRLIAPGRVSTRPSRPPCRFSPDLECSVGSHPASRRTGGPEESRRVPARPGAAPPRRSVAGVSRLQYL